MALDEEYDTLVVSDRWPALTHGLVDALHQRGAVRARRVRSRRAGGQGPLLALGVDATIAADAPMAEFVAALVELGPRATVASGPHRDCGTPPSSTATDATRPRCRPADGGGRTRGLGVTEIALGGRRRVARRRRGGGARSTPTTPRPRLPAVSGSTIEPNLCSAVEAAVHGRGRVDHADRAWPADAAGFDVVSGFPSATAAAQVTPPDVLAVVDALRRVVQPRDRRRRRSTPARSRRSGGSHRREHVDRGRRLADARWRGPTAGVGRSTRSIDVRGPDPPRRESRPADQFRRAEIDVGDRRARSCRRRSPSRRPTGRSKTPRGTAAPLCAAPSSVAVARSR